MATTSDERRRAKLRALAERHSLELAGISTILLPKSAARLAVLREAWLEIEPDARAGTLTGALAFCNFHDGWRPWAWHEWSEHGEEAT